MLEAAIRYAAAGWAVFPLNGKIPFPGTRGHHDATTDAEQIRRWWTARPDANIGCPVPTNLIVLDVDPRNGGDVAALGELPETATVWSGRGDGGQHLYFVRPRTPLTSTRLPDGIDLKVNGYCIAPPSLHPDSGRPYVWEDHPFAHLPGHVLDMLRYTPPKPRPAPKTAAEAGAAGQALVDHVARQEVGNRNAALYWAACKARDENLLDTIAADLVDAAVRAGENETRARATVESARRRSA